MTPGDLINLYTKLYKKMVWAKNGRSNRAKNGRSNPEVVGSIPTEVKRFFLYLVWFPDSLY